MDTSAESKEPKAALTDVKVDEGSLVDKPDNPPAKVVLLKAAWTVGVNRDLPTEDAGEWDGAAAAESVFTWAGWPDNPAPEKARQAFLVYDAEAPLLRGSYKLPIAAVKNGRLVVNLVGVRNAASRVPQTDIPQEVQMRLRDVVAAYLAEKEAPKACKPKEESGKAPKGLLAKLWDWATGASKQAVAPTWYTTEQALARQELQERFHQLRCAFLNSVASILDGAPDADKATLLQTSMEQFSQGLQDAIGEAGQPAGMGEEVEAAARKLRDAANSDLCGLAKREAFASGVAALDTARILWHGVGMTPTAKTAPTAPTESTAPTASTTTPASVPPVSVPVAATATATPAPSPDTSTTDKVEVAKREAERLEKQAEEVRLAKAKRWGFLGVPTESVAAILKRVADDVKLSQETDELFDSLAAQVHKAGEVLATTVGTAGTCSDPGSPEARLERLAQEIHKASPALSRSAAYAKAVTDHPELYKEIIAAR